MFVVLFFVLRRLRLAASSRVIEFEPGSWPAKTRFGSEILARVFGSGQRVGMKYLAYNPARLAKTRKIQIIFEKVH